MSDFLHKIALPCSTRRWRAMFLPVLIVAVGCAAMPAGGEDSAPSMIGPVTITRARHDRIVDYPWGRLRWHASADIGNSKTMTVGEATFKPGTGIPEHSHPNGDEIVHVLKGCVLFTVGDRAIELKEVDTANIPAGVHHGGRSIGATEAIMSVSFSSASRLIVWE